MVVAAIQCALAGMALVGQTCVPQSPGSASSSAHPALRARVPSSSVSMGLFSKRNSNDGEALAPAGSINDVGAGVRHRRTASREPLLAAVGSGR